MQSDIKLVTANKVQFPKPKMQVQLTKTPRSVWQIVKGKLQSWTRLFAPSGGVVFWQGRVRYVWAKRLER